MTGTSGDRIELAGGSSLADTYGSDGSFAQPAELVIERAARRRTAPAGKVFDRRPVEPAPTTFLTA